MATAPKQGSALGTGKLVPNRREGTRKVITNLTDLKTRHVEEEFKIMMAEDRRKAFNKVSQKKRGEENAMRINSQDELIINPEKPDLIGSGLK